jgi:hypothetical protein
MSAIRSERALGRQDGMMGPFVALQGKKAKRRGFCLIFKQTTKTVFESGY